MSDEILTNPPPQVILKSIFDQLPTVEEARRRLSETDFFPKSLPFGGELSRVLNTANITPVTKGLISSDFRIAYQEGKDPETDLFELIGIGESSISGDGIFSADAKKRMEIERAIYAKIIDSLTFLDPAEDGEYQESLVAELSRQFEALYGEPISSEAHTS